MRPCNSQTHPHFFYVIRMNDQGGTILGLSVQLFSYTLSANLNHASNFLFIQVIMFIFSMHVTLVNSYQTSALTLRH